MKPPSPQEYGLDQEKLEQIDKKVWRVRVLSAIPVGLVGGLLSLYWFYNFFLNRNTKDINFDMLMVGLPISIFIAAASGMAFFMLVLALPIDLFADHGKARRYHAALEQHKKDLLRAQTNRWTNLSTRRLQDQVLELYARLGYTKQPLPEGAPDFLDFAMRRETTAVLVSCRQQRGPVDLDFARAMLDAQKYFKFDRSIIISIPGFTPKVRRWAYSRTVGLISIAELINIENRLEAMETAAAQTEPG